MKTDRDRARPRRARPRPEPLEARQLLATILVTSAGDADGADRGPTLSLRQAIEIVDRTLPIASLSPAQAALVSGPTTPDTIDFAIPGAGPFAIALKTDLPTIENPATIDGDSEPGARPNDAGPGRPDDARIMIGIDAGQKLGHRQAPGLTVAAAGTTVRGLAIFGNAHQVPLDVTAHASFTAAGLAPGVHPIRAAYSGDAADTPGAPSAPVAVAVAAAGATTTQVVASTSLATAGQVVTFTASVAGPLASSAPTGLVLFGVPGRVLGAGVLNAGGVATFTTSELAIGPDPVRATYLGDAADAAGVSATAATVAVLPAAAAGGPTLDSGRFVGPEALALTFSRALDPARAEDLANYRLVGPDGRALAIVSATYDPASRTVTLRAARRIEPRRAYRLTADGLRIGRITDANGVGLDGDRDGRPGGDFAGAVTRGHLVIARPTPHGPRRPPRRVAAHGKA